MFAETDGSRKTIGDVDVVFHEGLYHLFHLVLPNHDFVAHAVSTNGIHWRRVNNALFIGDPGSWDDLMLWTMHVSPDPHRAGGWRMFYTGLTRRDRGHAQRIGVALSDDLFHWRKAPVCWPDHRGPDDPERIMEARRKSAARTEPSRHAPMDEESGLPLEPDPRYYEHAPGRRGWVSFRDPFYYREGDRGWLIVGGRMKDGPMVRRGCVALLEEVGENRFESRPPLYHPGLYDDIEVPNLIRLDGEFYLIGSIREDAKIRYWHTDRIGAPWRSNHDNVLMAKGNYAGRVCRDDRGWLLWNFFSMDPKDRANENLMPPPKRLIRDPDGLLRITTFEGLDAWILDRVDSTRMRGLRPGDEDQRCTEDQRFELEQESGFQAYVFDESLDCFQLRMRLRTHGKGKCGIVFRVDPETHDGYYISLDLLKGLAQLRRWKTGPDGSGDLMMQYKALQQGNWYSDTRGTALLQLIAFGNYLELSIDGRVVLSLADRAFETGRVGVYLETARLELSEVELCRMRSPHQRMNQMVAG